MFEWDSGAGTHLGVEMELDHVTNCCADVAGREDERAVGSSDIDDVSVDHS
jgi:hypothetical protein